MASPSDQFCCFCDNMKAYHIEGEDQFYDLTIKDKDDAEIRSHKFLLASQSDYFDALFRRVPTASETTFKNFSLDVIKTCIDYLYNHEIDLTGSNVQDVLIFADYISLKDVIAICTDYIIDNIDLSNYARVIDLGSNLRMDKLVETVVVFFVLRNITTNNQMIDSLLSLDEFTKGTIMKVADWQQERVTIMTTEQWNINRLKTFLFAPEEDSNFQARSSSVCNGNPDCWEAKRAINGEISKHGKYYFKIVPEMHPWLEVKLPSPVLIASVTIINRKNACQEMLKNVEVRAGMEPVPKGFIAQERGNNASKKLEVNSKCGYFDGPASGFISEGHVITFDQPTLAQYITVQIMKDKGYLRINGLKINGGDLLNVNDLVFPRSVASLPTNRQSSPCSNSNNLKAKNKKAE